MLSSLDLSKPVRLLGFGRSGFHEEKQKLADREFAKFKHLLLDRDGHLVGGRHYAGRMRVRDATAITFRMGAGFLGDVNRNHPSSIVPCLIDPTNPPTFYGQALVAVAASNGVRMVMATDGALTDIFGISVRPFPFQSATVPGSTNYGAATIGGISAPPTSGVLDVLKSGYILVPVVGTPALGGTVDVWFAASVGTYPTAGFHLQGGFEATHTGGSSFTITGRQTLFQGGVDANQVGEIAVNP